MARVKIAGRATQRLGMQKLGFEGPDIDYLVNHFAELSSGGEVNEALVPGNITLALQGLALDGYPENSPDAFANLCQHRSAMVDVIVEDPGDAARIRNNFGDFLQPTPDFRELPAELRPSPIYPIKGGYTIDPRVMVELALGARPTNPARTAMLLNVIGGAAVEPDRVVENITPRVRAWAANHLRSNFVDFEDLSLREDGSLAPGLVTEATQDCPAIAVKTLPQQGGIGVVEP